MSTAANMSFADQYYKLRFSEDSEGEHMEGDHIAQRKQNMEMWERMNKIVSNQIKYEFTENTFHSHESQQITQDSFPPILNNENKHSNMKSQPYAKRRNFRVESQEEKSDFMDGIRRMKDRGDSLILNKFDEVSTGYYKNMIDAPFQDNVAPVVGPGIFINDDVDNEVDLDDEDDTEFEEDND